MKLKLKKTNRPYFLLYVNHTSKPYLIDNAVKKRVSRIAWHYSPAHKMAHGTVKKGLYMFLHKYIARLNHKKWQEIYFSNGDRFDCRIGNLRPYDRSADGARRKMFKNNTSGKRGVYYIKSTQKWYSVMKYKGKTRYLGVFPTADEAAKAYQEEYQSIYGRKSEISRLKK